MMMYSSHGRRRHDQNVSTVGSPDNSPLMGNSADRYFDSPSSQSSIFSSPSSSPRRNQRPSGPNRFIKRGFVCCTVVATITVVVCLYVDKEAVMGLHNRSSSLIRKKIDKALLAPSDPDARNVDNDDNNEKGKIAEMDQEEDVTNENSIQEGSEVYQEEEVTTEEDAKEERAEENAAESQKNSSNMVVHAGADKRRNLVLHVGPQKTGSTTLQDAWNRPDSGLIKPLRDDNYRYIFINPRSGYFDCEVVGGGYTSCRSSAKLIEDISEATSKGQNLLLSDENLSLAYAGSLREVIDDNDWKVTVVVVYRRIHEWLVSWYNQINKTTNKDEKGNFLLDENGNPRREEHKHWPQDGGQHVLTFITWYKLFTSTFDRSDLVSHHTSISFMNAYKPLFDNVVVYNMHQEGDLVENFMCHIVPDAKQCCSRLKSGALEIPLANGSVNLDYDIIAVEAKERGILMSALSRKEVTEAVARYVQQTGRKIPRYCDSDVIEEIRKWLLDSEAFMFSDSWTGEQAEYLSQVYESYLGKGLLCDVDIEAVFADKDWIAFFRALDNRPTLVIHIGPQKTGSSTLQEVWNSPKELLSFLQEDNFSYEQINPHRGTFDCEVNGGTFSNCRASLMTKKLLADVSQKGHNLLLSDENLDERYAPALREVIDDGKFRVRVVLVYRRIHEWLVSWYNQINKSTNKDSKGDYLLDKNGNPVREDHKLWPDQGGIHVPGFIEWYRNFSKYWLPSNLVEKHPTIRFKNAYTPLFDDVEVYNMHQEGDFVTNFMCQMIPEAKKSCKTLREGLYLPQFNPSVKLDHDIIAVAAHEKGLVNKLISRQDVVAAVTKYIERSGKILPRKCDTEVTNQIRDWLIASEVVILPDTKREDLERIFDSYIENGKLCDADMETALEDEEWISFFASLDPSRFSTSSDAGFVKKNLVLHVGPQKTGSSTLQTAWEIMRTNTLQQDNYNYKHTMPAAHDFDCDIGRFGGFRDCVASQNLKNLISSSRDAGRNLILSDENLDERFVHALREVIDDDHWNVSVVVVYRRIHEWLASWYNEINKTTNVDSNGNILIDKYGNPYREEHNHWPDKGGIRVPDFSEWYSKFIQYWDPAVLVSKHRSVEYYNLYRPLFEKVTVYDLHRDGDLVTNFMCEVVPQADHSCLRLQKKQLTLPIINPSVNLEHDILAVYAYDQGYLKPSLSRKDVVAAVSRYVVQSKKTLPRKCDPSITKQIYDWLVESEKIMFASTWSPERNMAINEAYQSYVANGRLCDVDVEEALRDQDWANFFESLGG